MLAAGSGRGLSGRGFWPVQLFPLLAGSLGVGLGDGRLGLREVRTKRKTILDVGWVELRGMEVRW